MSLNNAITKLINDRVDQFIAKLAKEYPNVDISAAKKMWENISECTPESPKEKETKKPKDAPKRSKTAYMFFCAEKRPIIKKKHSSLTVGEINKMLGGMWEIERDSVSNDFKRFEEMAKKEKENPIEVQKPEKEKSEKGKPENKKDKCTEILKTGKNKGSECGKPVKENGLCGRHFILNKSGNNSEDNSDKEKEKKESEDTQEIEAEIPKENPPRKCNFILQSGKNKGSECGKPSGENKMCGRHTKLVQEYEKAEKDIIDREKEKRKNEEKANEVNNDREKEIEKRGEKISKLTQSMRKNGKIVEADEIDKTVKLMRESGREVPKEVPKRNPPKKYDAFETFEIEELNEKLTEIYQEKINWIIIRNMDPEKMYKGKKFNYYIISGLEDGLFYIECELFGGEIELIPGSENTAQIIIDNLSNVDEFHTVPKECSHVGLKNILGEFMRDPTVEIK